jgi:hypothetical protein
MKRMTARGSVVELREFKTKYMARLLEIKKHLLEKYPDKRDRVEFIVDTLLAKLTRLRRYTLPDYLSTLARATKDFKELEALIPPKEEVEELLKGGE